jgi:beta-lactamase regulating signal transducer with metallopeptidase domain
MSERILIEYVLNALWQIPLLWLGASALVRVARLRPGLEHRVWLATLLLCALLPTAGLRDVSAKPAVGSPAAVAPSPVLDLRAQVSAIAPTTAPSASALPEPAARPLGMPHVGVRVETMQFGPQTIRCFAWGYSAIVLFGLIRLLLDWQSVRPVLRNSSPYIVEDAEGALWQELGERMRVKLPPVRCSAEVASPVVLGVFRPVLVLPEEFAGCSLAELRAALAHELAHVQRRDCLVNVLCRLAALPVFWHPLVGLVQQAIARTREMICDELAARQMRSDVAYARCLLNLAKGMMRDGNVAFAGSGMRLFDSNQLEERVMRLTEEKRVLSVQETFVRRLGAVVVAGAVMTAGAMVHVAPVVAQESAPTGAGSHPIQVQPAAEASTPAPISPAAVVPAARQAPSAPTDHARAQTTPGHTTPAPSEPDARGAGPSVGTGPSGTAVGTDVFEDDDFAVARGQNAHVRVSKGRYLHRWVGADGETYESADENPKDLTAEQKRAMEAEFARRMAQLDAQVAFWKSPAYREQVSQQANMAAVEAEVAAATAQLNSPEFKLQMQKLNSPEFKAEIDRQTKELAKLNSPEFKAQLDAQMAELQRKLETLKSPDTQRQLEDAAKRLDEATKTLQEATHALKQAQEQMQRSVPK